MSRDRKHNMKPFENGSEKPDLLKRMTRIVQMCAVYKYYAI